MSGAIQGWEWAIVGGLLSVVGLLVGTVYALAMGRVRAIETRVQTITDRVAEHAASLAAHATSRGYLENDLRDLRTEVTKGFDRIGAKMDEIASRPVQCPYAMRDKQCLLPNGDG